MDCTPIFINAQKAGRELNTLSVSTINQVLLLLADEADASIQYIISENEKDLALMESSDPRYDRLLLTPARIRSITSDIRKIAALPSPVGRIISENYNPDGLKIIRERVPFGVIAIIYEARPNVTFDVFSLCLKSGNACILKGGSDAINSNYAIIRIIKETLEKCNVNRDAITFLSPSGDETLQLLNARGYVDLLIPRGSQGLINYVRENATVPVIETGAGICHTYFDEYGDLEKGKIIINNAKTRRVSVCNALDCLVIHESRIKDLGTLVELCSAADVIIYADDKAFAGLKGKYPETLLKRATPDSFGTEFLSYKMAVKTVGNFSEALDHIAKYSSKHSEAIISEDRRRLDEFCRNVDAAAVFANASTAFTDGAEFGLGAEIGISTQKLHARGPMSLEEMTTYKWIIHGDGHIRP